MEQRDAFVANKLKTFSLDEKIGQLFTLGFAGGVVYPYITDFIERYHCGGLRLSPQFRTFGRYINPKTGKPVYNPKDNVKSDTHVPFVKRKAHITSANVNRPSDYKHILDGLQARAKARPSGLPLHFSFDQEGSESADFFFGGVTLFPSCMGLRATGDAKYAEKAAFASGKQAKLAGFSWVHSPVLDINSNHANPEVYTRAYSDKAEEVAEYALAACRGYKEAGMITTGKHFPGRGDSDLDAHFEIPVIDIDEKTLFERELLPYKALFEEDLLPTIMIAHSIFPAIDDEHIATVSKKVVTGFLRERLGFKGVITTDSISMGGVVNRYGIVDAVALSLEAGADIVLLKVEDLPLIEESFRRVKAFIESGRITEKELDEKVTRLLTMKYEYGLFDDANVSDEEADRAVSEPGVVSLATEIAEKSIIVARNTKNVLPLPKDSKDILVVEQVKGYRPNDTHFHPGILWEACLAHNKDVNYLEVEDKMTDTDKEEVLRLAKEYEYVVITNYYRRGRTVAVDFINTLIDEAKGHVIVVTNTPFALSVPERAETVVVTFSVTSAHVKQAAKVLFGEAESAGEWPVERSV